MNPFLGLISSFINLVIGLLPVILIIALLIGLTLIKDKIKNSMKAKRQEKRRREEEEEDKKRLNSLIKKYGDDFGKLIFDEKIKVGMTKEMIEIVKSESSFEFNGFYYYRYYEATPFDTKIKYENDEAVIINKIKDPFWIDMNKDIVLASWGEPEDEIKSVSKKGEKLKWYYGGRTTQQYTRRYKYEVQIENDNVVAWKELE